MGSREGEIQFLFCIFNSQAVVCEIRLNRQPIKKHSDSSTSSVVTSPDLETTEDPVAVAESLPHSLAAAADEDEPDEAELSRQHSRQVGK